MTGPATVIVLAKAPVPGRSKTRLSPPFTPQQAASLALAALEDTLAAALACRASRLVLALDGEAGSWLPKRFEVMPQRGEGLDERLGAAFLDTGDPALLVGMDTPQLTPDLLNHALDALGRADAILGDTLDGGYWGVGLNRPDVEAFNGVPMSTECTSLAQRHRFESLGLSCASLPRLRDVDFFEDAIAVAGCARRTRFAGRLASLRPLIERRKSA